jgi:hypothetical protein
MTQEHENELDYIRSYLALDPDSPSGLVWIKTTSRKVKPGMVAGYSYGTGYYKVQLNGKRYRASHLVLYLNGIYPEKGCTEVDHIDRNPWNNAVSNLRWTTRSGNLSNRRVLGAVNYRYVHRSRGHYAAQYIHPASKKQVFVGRYATPLEAHLQALVHRLENHWIEQ